MHYETALRPDTMVGLIERFYGVGGSQASNAHEGCNFKEHNY